MYIFCKSQAKTFRKIHNGKKITAFKLIRTISTTNYIIKVIGSLTRKRHLWTLISWNCTSWWFKTAVTLYTVVDMDTIKSTHTFPPNELWLNVRAGEFCVDCGNITRTAVTGVTVCACSETLASRHAARIAADRSARAAIPGLSLHNWSSSPLRSE